MRKRNRLLVCLAAGVLILAVSATAAFGSVNGYTKYKEALKALAEVLGQIESAEKLAETAFTIFASEDFHQQIIKISPEMVERGEME